MMPKLYCLLKSCCNKKDSPSITFNQPTMSKSKRNPYDIRHISSACLNSCIVVQSNHDNAKPKIQKNECYVTTTSKCINFSRIPS